MNKKVLITGITGFAGSHLAELLVSKNEYDVVGTHVSDKNLPNVAAISDSITLYKVDLVDAAETTRIIAEVRPEIIFHLAALPSPAQSFKNPTHFMQTNINSEVNIFQALVEHKIMPEKVIIITSSEIYGKVTEKDLPITEQTELRPVSPYGVSKIAQDYLALQYYLSYEIAAVRLRPFNHIGPRLSADISISRWAKIVAEIEKGKYEPVLRVGNMTTRRDFTDVRDMVRAYELAALHAMPGEAYNVGSGVSHSMQEMLDKLLSFSSVPITVEVDQSLFRPGDIQELRANASKFVQVTGWEPEIALEKTLQDTLDYWRKVV